MPKQAFNCNSYSVLFLLVTFFISALFISAPGTYDMQIWVEWIRKIDLYGFARGFAVINDVNPPFGSVLLSIVSHAASIINLPELYAIKLSVSLFLWISTVIILVWTRNLIIAALFQLLLTINVGFGYLDIYYTPFLLGAFFALDRGKYAIALFCYTIAALIKSQPLLLAPFIISYIWFHRPLTGKSHIMKWCAQIIMPSFLIIIMPVIVIYNKSLIVFLENAQHAHYISGNALNLGWIMTYIIRIFHLFGSEGLISWGHNDYIPHISVISGFLKGLFFIAYGFTFYRFCTDKDKTSPALYKYMSAAFFSYFALNSGVHENHFFIFMVLCILLYSKAVINALELCLSALFGNLNLILFYGIDGQGLPFDRGIFPLIDISIIFSFLLLWFFMTYYCRINNIDIHGVFLRLRNRIRKLES